MKAKTGGLEKNGHAHMFRYEMNCLVCGHNVMTMLGIVGFVTNGPTSRTALLSALNNTSAKAGFVLVSDIASIKIKEQSGISGMRLMD
jgi:hypothetical protein